VVLVTQICQLQLQYLVKSKRSFIVEFKESLGSTHLHFCLYVYLSIYASAVLFVFPLGHELVLSFLEVYFAGQRNEGCFLKKKKRKRKEKSLFFTWAR